MFYIKPTEPGKHFIAEVDEKPHYPIAKNYYLIPGDLRDDSEWLTFLIKITQAALPEHKPKKAKVIKK